MRSWLTLLLLLGSIFALPPNFVRVAGDVLFDGEKIATIESDSPAFIALPLLPGEHEIESSLGKALYHIFDVRCETFKGIKCVIDSHANITLPVEIKCGGVEYSASIEMRENESKEIKLECEGNATVRIGDWKKNFFVEKVFVNEVNGDGGKWIYVYRDGELVLKKYGKGKISFPELKPGTYRIVIVDNSTTQGKLVVEGGVRLMMMGYALATLLVITALVLLMTD